MKVIQRISFINIKLLLLIIFCMFLLTSCSQSVGDEDKGKHVNAKKSSQSSIETNKVDASEKTNFQEENLDELKKAIKEAINDDIWYSGKYSAFYDFESKTSKIYIYKYKNPDDSSLIDIYFDRPFKAGSYFQGDKQYLSIYIGKGKRGYGPEVVGYYGGDTSEIVRDRIKDLGYVFYKTDEITFDKVMQPTFSSMSEKKVKLLLILRVQ